MEYSSPPPLFKQGASARAKVAFFAMIAVVLLVVDIRTQSLLVVRQMVGAGLYPLQAVALAPRDALYRVGDYFAAQTRLEQENQHFRRQHADDVRALQQAQFLAVENLQLRKLLALREQLPVKSVSSEILYDTRDPFTRKIVLDRGSRDGVAAGQPVVDDTGVLGQVTRVFRLTAEVSLLTDKDQAIPVQVLRNGLRSVAYGRGQSGLLELRFLVANSDIRNGDVLVTSGIDGVYPPGLAVARISQIENKVTDAFARVVCQPLAGLGRHRQLLVLLTEAKPLPQIEVDDREATKERSGGRAARARAKREASGTPAVRATSPAKSEKAPLATGGGR